jgi:hypothetical protein
MPVLLLQLLLLLKWLLLVVVVVVLLLPRRLLLRVSVVTCQPRENKTERARPIPATAALTTAIVTATTIITVIKQCP